MTGTVPTTSFRVNRVGKTRLPSQWPRKDTKLALILIEGVRGTVKARCYIIRPRSPRVDIIRALTVFRLTLVRPRLSSRAQTRVAVRPGPIICIVG